MSELFTMSLRNAWERYVFFTEEKSQDVQICFVSGDTEFRDFQKSDTLPFLRVPYEAFQTRGILHDKFEVDGYPALMIINLATGETITRDTLPFLRVPYE